MTREQAINYLKSSGMSEKQIETVINAFTYDDCISRQDVMAIIECAYDECIIDGYTDYCEMRDMVRGLPSVKPQESEDCISRQALLEKAIIVPIAKVVTEDKVICRKVVFVEDIKELPTVTPKGVTITDFADRCRECGRINLCEDCISREAVIDIIDFEDKWLFDANGHNANTKIAFSGLRSRVKALPSVTSEAESEAK